MQSKGNHSALLVGMRLVRSLWKTVWNFLSKLKMELPFDPAILVLGLYPKSPETPNQKSLCTPMFIAAQVYDSRVLEARTVYLHEPFRITQTP